MALLNYSSNEALERIYKMLSAATDPDDQEGLLGQMPFDEALTRIAQLLEGSLGDASFSLPSAAIATVAEVNAGTDNTVILTPYGHTISHEYGGIYVSTGTVEQSFVASTWTKITGAFQNYTAEDSGAEITCDFNDDRLVLNETGVWFIQYQFMVVSPNGGNATVLVRPYASGTAYAEAQTTMVLSPSGTAVAIGFGPLNVPTTGWPVDLRVNPSSTITMKLMSAQLYARKEVG